MKRSTIRFSDNKKRALAKDNMKNRLKWVLPVLTAVMVLASSCSKAVITAGNTPADMADAGEEKIMPEEELIKDTDDGFGTADVEKISEEIPDTDKDDADAAQAAEEEYELTDIVIAVDSRFGPGSDKAMENFISSWEQTVSENHGINVKLEMNSYSRDEYVEEVGSLLNARHEGAEAPDALIMSASMFKAYSDAGYLWDMAGAYDAADFQKRIAQPDVNEDLKDEDGRMYGFMPCYGNGCITYVKASWFDIYAKNTEGIDKIEDIDTFDKYYDMLKYFSAGNVSGVIAAGYITEDEPYIDMLPEFWQDAYPVFYLDGDEWVDGFTQQANIVALDRIALAVKEGVIDSDTKEADVEAAREKFTSAARSRSEMSLNYWAGDWMRTLTAKMEENGVDTDLEDDRLLMLPPIKEIVNGRGGYLRGEAPVWVIVDDGDGNSAREQAVFNVLFETMLDGDAVQKLWMKNTKNVNWEYCIAPVETDASRKDELVERSKEFLRRYSAEKPISAPIDVADPDVKKLVKARVDLIHKVADGKCSGKEAVDEYKQKYGEISEKIIKELNGR